MPFGPPPVPETVSRAELKEGPALEDQRIDERYEYLLEE